MGDPPNPKAPFSTTPPWCSWQKQWRYDARHVYLVSVFGKKKKEKGKHLCLLPWIAKSAEECAALQELQIRENNDIFADLDTLDNEIHLDDILHGAEILPYSHGGEDIDQLGQAILGGLWEWFVSLFSTLWAHSPNIKDIISNLAIFLKQLICLEWSGMA